MISFVLGDTSPPVKVLTNAALMALKGERVFLLGLIALILRCLQAYIHGNISIVLAQVAMIILTREAFQYQVRRSPSYRSHETRGSDAVMEMKP